jgi:hypothetical protein
MIDHTGWLSTAFIPVSTGLGVLLAGTCRYPANRDGATDSDKAGRFASIDERFQLVAINRRASFPVAKAHGPLRR